MNKKIIAFATLALLVGCVTSCGDPVSTTTSINGNNSTTTNTPTTSVTDEQYVIRVTAPQGIVYQLSKERAKAGEVVSLTITELPSGFSVKEVTVNGVTINATSTGSYEFTMPNRSVTVTIYCSVSGEVTLVGDVVAVLEKEGDIYVARNVKVAKSGRNYFSYQVTSENGVSTVLDSIDLDPYKCFADIESSYQKTYNLEIAGGCTYDFYYDPSAIYPCYVIRTEVHDLPNSVASLYTLFDGSSKSESTINYPGLNRIEYSTLNRENIDDLKMIDYDMKYYEGNAAYAKVESTLDSKTYHVYKDIDETTNMLTIVDTYTKANGNDDRHRYSHNNYGSYAGKWDIVDNSLEDITNTEVRERDALVNISHGAHYGYYLERDFMDAYRVGYSADEMTSNKIDISSSKDSSTGDFTTTIDSYIEYDSSAGTYTAELHQSYIFKAELVFDAAGRVKSVDYSKTKYEKAQWDFGSHSPLVGQDGTVVKTVEATYSYGDLYSVSELEFDTTPYFVSSIDAVHFYNAKTGMPANDGKSYLHFGDKVSLNDLYNSSYAFLDTFNYSPATSLDVWQYGPVASSNEDVIKHQSNDLWWYMSCVGIGKSTVTFSNHTKNSGVSVDVEINVNATQKFHSVAIYSTWGGYPGDTTSATSANITAGTVQSFKISVTPSSAPVIYDAVSEKPELLSVVETGEKLTLDATGAKDIKTPTTVRVKITSDWYNPDVINKYTMLSFTIIPMALNPVGSTWGFEGLEEHVKVNFTAEEDSSSTETQKIYKGSIEDDGYIDGTTFNPSLDVDFIYSYVNGKVIAQVTAIHFSSNTDGWSTNPLDYAIEFYYEASSDRFGLFLAEAYYDSEYEGFIYSPLFGNCDSDGIATEYSPFVRID